MSDTSARFQIVEPSADRHDAADVPLYIRNIVSRIEAVGAQYGQGTFASMPAAGVQGRFYAAMDLVPPKVYYDNGATWNDVGAIPNSSVTDAMLASPQSGVPHKLADASVAVSPGDVSGLATYIIGAGSSIHNIGAVSPADVPFFHLDPAKFAIPGKTPKLQLWSQIVLNATPWTTTNLACELRPLTPSGGGAATVTFTVGAPVMANNYGGLGASALYTTYGPDTAFPAAGLYAFCLTTSVAVLPVNSLSILAAQLMLRWV